MAAWGAPSRPPGRELWRKMVGLMGFGAVGRAVAHRLRRSGRAAWSTITRSSPRCGATGGRRARRSLAELLAASDFVTLHAAATDSSRGLIGAAELSQMRRGACLVNTARAALVDEPALVRALESGHLGGAALDVFSIEPPAPDHPLLKLPNVVATPHVGGNTVDVAAHQGRIVAEELERLLAWDGATARPQPGYARQVSLGRATTRRQPRDEAAAARACGPRRDRSTEEAGAGARAEPARRRPGARADAGARRNGSHGCAPPRRIAEREAAGPHDASDRRLR